MLDIGFQELVVIFIVALVAIGPQKLPELSRKLGKWVAEIRRGIDIAKSQIAQEMNKDISSPDATAQALQETDEGNEVINKHKAKA